LWSVNIYIGDLFFKVILLATSDRHSTTFGLRYGSYDAIWEDNQGKVHMRINIDVVPQWIMTRNHDTSVCRAAQPCVGRPQEALGFVAAPLVATHNTITDHTTKVKFQVTQFGW
jgi:hypothetical protein